MVNPMVTAAGPIGRAGQPDGVAGVIGFQASPASRWTTGQVIDASGEYRL
jgi:NAD(P)-dependent dehydrogenase (short-subunit alcohol dehydrogenase family)